MLPEKLDGWGTRRLAEVYLAVGLAVSALLCVLTPPFDTPDEIAHAQREIQLAHGGLIAVRTPEGAGGGTDSNFEIVAAAMARLRGEFNEQYGVGSRLPDGRVTEGELAPWQGVAWSGRPGFARFPNTAVYPPGLYLPQAMGWRVGEAAGLSILHTLLLARFLAMLCAVGVGWVAMRRCRRGRWLLLGYLLLPTVLSLGASCSQDALMMPLMALMMVVLMRAVEERRGLRVGEVAGLAGMMILTAGARVPYLPLALVLLLPALDAEEAGWRKLILPGAGVVAVVAVVGAWQAAVHSLGVYVGPGANPALQVAFLRGHALRGGMSLVEAVGREVPVTMAKGLFMLGSNDAGPPHALYAVMGVGLGGVWLLNPMAGLRSVGAKVVLGLALLGTIAAIWLAEYVVWTPPGAVVVEGFQARYFVALIPLGMMLGWQPTLMRLTGKLREGMMLAAAAMFLVGVLSTPFVAARVFYLSGPVHALSFLLR